MSASSPQPSHSASELLAQLISQGLYRGNALRVTGLPVGATVAQIKRRRDEVLRPARVSRQGADEEAERAFAIIGHLPQRIAHELFVPWCLADAEQCTSSDHDLVHQHDRTIRIHEKSLEAELATDKVNSRARAEVLDSWARTLKSGAMTRWLQQRISVLADPQLGPDWAREVEEALPAELLRAEALLAVELMSDGQSSTARELVSGIRLASFPEGLAERILREVSAPIQNRLRGAIEDARRKTTISPAAGAEIATSLINSAALHLDKIGLLLGPKSQVATVVADQTAAQANRACVAQNNESGPHTDVVAALRRAQPLAHGQETEQSIGENLRVIEREVAFDAVRPAIERLENSKFRRRGVIQQLIRDSLLPALANLRRLTIPRSTRVEVEDLCATSLNNAAIRLHSDQVDEALAILDQARALVHDPETARQIQENVRALLVGDTERVMSTELDSISRMIQDGSTTEAAERARSLLPILSDLESEVGAADERVAPIRKIVVDVLCRVAIELVNTEGQRDAAIELLVQALNECVDLSQAAEIRSAIAALRRVMNEPPVRKRTPKGTTPHNRLLPGGARRFFVALGDFELSLLGLIVLGDASAWVVDGTASSYTDGQALTLGAASSALIVFVTTILFGLGAIPLAIGLIVLACLIAVLVTSTRSQ